MLKFYEQTSTTTELPREVNPVFVANRKSRKKKEALKSTLYTLIQSHECRKRGREKKSNKKYIKYRSKKGRKKTRSIPKQTVPD